MAEGVPVLTAVAPAYREAWAAFSGGAAVLPLDEAATRAWLDATLAPQPA
jgi:hypothetical protein